MVSQANIVHIQETTSNIAWLYLLTITAGDNPPLRLVNNLEPIWSRGLEYLPYPFKIRLPQDVEGQLPNVTLEIDNIAGEIIEAIREFAEPPEIKVELISTAYPDVPEKVLDYLKLRSVTYDSMTVTGTMDVNNILTRRFPGSTYSPAEFPGLFYVVAISAIPLLDAINVIKSTVA